MPSNLLNKQNNKLRVVPKPKGEITMDDYSDSYYLPYSVVGNNFEIYYIPKAIDDYIELSQQICSEKNFNKKLFYCYQQLKLLPFWIKDELSIGDFIPPVVPCRDWGPKLHMYKGEWDKARDFILQCDKANAYYPNHGENELKELADFQYVAEIALSYISIHPGVLQKDIYTILNNQIPDINILKRFTRWSTQIRKEPYKRTNKLFVSN